MEGISNHFPAKNAPESGFWHIQSQNFCGRDIPAEVSGAWNKAVEIPKHQFPLGSPAFQLFLFFETDHCCVWFNNNNDDL